MKDAHKGSLKVNVRVMCLDAVKMYGNRPRKLFTIIKKNRAIKIKDLPTKDDGPRRVLNSLLIFLMRDSIKIKILVGVTQ